MQSSAEEHTLAPFSLPSFIHRLLSLTTTSGPEICVSDSWWKSLETG